MADSKSQFTKEEEARIQAAVSDAQQKAREELIQTEIRNRILDAQNSQPGHRY
ncbi:MAG: hypothetical protein NC548_13245 [Lachnospiraceae bacterium]|nr:hypothetical protein [Lachnospiraceae bacterium]MCM1230644.1 hypothetical protein [Ruminococcus flavefaciens]